VDTNAIQFSVLAGVFLNGIWTPNLLICHSSIGTDKLRLLVDDYERSVCGSMSGKEYQDGLKSLKYGRQQKVLTERGSREGHEVSLTVRKSKYSRREGVDFFLERLV
jgi:hypothetical protein